MPSATPKLNEIENAHSSPVTSARRASPARAGPQPDVVVIDPPAPGCRPRWSAACSSARRRDRLHLLQSDHARPERRAAGRRRLSATWVRAVDMFPHTPHIECVALIEEDAVGRTGRPAARVRGRRRARPGGRAAASRGCESLGYASLWSNDHPAANGLETVAVFGPPHVHLGVAVIAIDRMPPPTSPPTSTLGIDPARLWLGSAPASRNAPGSRARGAARPPPGPSQDARSWSPRWDPRCARSRAPRPTARSSTG